MASTSTSIHSLLVLPVTPFICSLAICTLVLGFSSHASPVVRPLGLVLMTACILHGVYIVRARDSEKYDLSMSMFMGSTASMLMHYLDSALLSAWSYDAQGPTAPYGGHSLLLLRRRSGPEKPKSKPKADDDIKEKEEHDQVRRQNAPSASFWTRLQYGWEESFRTRSAGTPWAIDHIPPFFKEDPKKLPSRAEFVYWSLRRCVICLVLVDAVCYMGRDTSQNPVMFASSRIPLFSRLGDVTAEEVVLRVVASCLHWIVTTLYLHAIYDGVAAVLIGLDCGRVERWPPLYGSVLELYSVRQFWGSFWHQGVRQIFGAPAHFLTFYVLGLSRGSLLARYTKLDLTFLISGIFHAYGDYASGVPWREVGALKFFVMQAVGVMIEDAVQAAYRGLTGGRRTSKRPALWVRFVGFFWLLFWLVWTTPTWTYPTSQRATGESILPFSLFNSS